MLRRRLYGGLPEGKKSPKYSEVIRIDRREESHCD